MGDLQKESWEDGSQVADLLVRFWTEEEGYLRISQIEPWREVLLSGQAAALWRLIDERRTVDEIKAAMEEQGAPAGAAEELLRYFCVLGLISFKNYLWAGEA